MTPSRRPPVRLPRERDAEGRPRNARPRDRYGRPLPRGAVDEMAHREEPDDVVDDVDAAVDRAAALFDAQRFFEAHEFLEWVWKSEDVPPGDRDYWKGVTQVAAACCHVQRGNAVGALRMLERAVAYLAEPPRDARGIDREALAAAAEGVAAAVRAAGASPGLDFPTLPRR